MTEYLTAFLIGLFSSTHCMSMCGGIVTFLSLSANDGHNKLLYQLLYNCGRIFSYILIAIVINFIGSIFLDLTGAYMLLVFKSVSNLILIIIGLHISNIFHGIFYLERIFSKFWTICSKIIVKMKAYNSIFFPFILGFFWGQIPCGLVYSTLIWTIGFNSILKSAVLMLLFGMGTAPSMIFFGYSSVKVRLFLNNVFLRIVLGFVLVLFGLINIILLILSKECH